MITYNDIFNSSFLIFISPMPFFVFQYRRFGRRGDWQAVVLTGLFLM